MAELTPIIGRGKVFSKQLKQLRKQRKRMLSYDKPPKDKRQKIEKTPPRLEHLPPELLQEIFLYSCEVNLPLASLQLAGKLSHTHLYMSLCLQVLFKDDYFLLDPDTTYDDQDLADVNFTVNEYLAAGDDLNLQSDLLKTRWFGWDFYRKYLENAFDASYKRHRRWISKERRAQDESSSHSQPSNRQSIYEKKLEEPQRIDLEDEDLTVRKEPQYRWFRLLPNCRIPDKLLRAPFSHDQYTFLKTLILAGAVVDWYGTAAGELAEAALEYAIREASADLVRLLLHEAIGIPWQESYLEQAYREQARQSKHDFEPIIVQLTERRERDGHQNGGS